MTLDTPPSSLPKKKIVIVGGSLGGLFSGTVLSRLGHDVTILERTPSSQLADQGAGMSTMPIQTPVINKLQELGLTTRPLVEFFKTYDRTNTPYYNPRTGLVLTLGRDGGIKATTDISKILPIEGGITGAASWDAMYNVARANFDGGYEGSYVTAAPKEEGDGEATYLSGVTVSDIKNLGDKVEIVHSKGSLVADFVIGADGGSSTVRKLFLPKAERKYVGYLVWRGTVKESELSEEIRAMLGDNFVAHYRKGEQAMMFNIPGKNGSIEIGERSTNLVWYNNVEDPTDLLTDSAGVQHKFSLGIGKLRTELRDKQREKAKTLPPQLRELFTKIQSPFIQAITDSLATKATFLDGKVVLLGDALACLRPHLTAGAVSGALQALLLGKVFENKISLDEWEEKVLDFVTFAQGLGVQIGNLAQFGDHPMADNGDES